MRGQACVIHPAPSNLCVERRDAGGWKTGVGVQVEAVLALLQPWLVHRGDGKQEMWGGGGVADSPVPSLHAVGGGQGQAVMLLHPW